MKICHIISNTNTGGAELSMLAHLKLFSNPKKYQTSVISLTTIGVIGIKIQRECQIPVYEVGISRDIRSILKLSRFVKLIGGIKPDVIIAWMYHANILSALLFPQICVIWNIRHSLEYFESENYLTRVLIRGGRFLSTRPHRIIYNSLNSKEQHEISFGYCTERSQTINNGVDCVRYQPKNNDNRKKISIGIAGRYHPIKNHELFFQVLKKIIENHHHVIAVSAGRGMNENNFELFQRLQYWGLTEHVVLLDELEDMKYFYNNIDLLISASESEGFSNVIVEAMACGVPVIATDVGESKQIISREEAVIPPGDPSALFQAVNHYLGMDELEKQKLREQSRNRAVKFFSNQSLKKEFMKVYDTLDDQ